LKSKTIPILYKTFYNIVHTNVHVKSNLNEVNVRSVIQAIVHQLLQAVGLQR